VDDNDEKEEEEDDDDDDGDDDDDQTRSSLTDLFDISVSHPSQSQFTLHNHQSTYIPLPLLLLPVSGRLMALLIPYLFSSTVGKSMFVCLFNNILFL
jgi:hypothetical protein